MLVIWRGWGWIVPVFLFVPLVIVEIVIERIAGDENLYQAQMWPKILGAGIGAVLVALLGYYFNWVRRPQLVRESKPVPSLVGRTLVKRAGGLLLERRGLRLCLTGLSARITSACRRARDG